MKDDESFIEKIEKLKALAIKFGASENLIKVVNVKEDVIIQQWPRIKCKFGCKNYGKNLCCPPYIPEVSEWKNFLNDYNRGLLIGFQVNILSLFKDPKKSQLKLFKLERSAFLMGFYKAFVYFTGPCMLCKKCITHDLEFPKDIDANFARKYCKNIDKARPSMEATGIDVFGTVRKAGLELEVIKSKGIEQIRFYTLLLLD